MGSLPSENWEPTSGFCWLGFYVWPEGQRVRAEDAANLADALVCGLASESTFACDLRRIVCLCRGGGFEVQVGKNFEK